MIYKRRGQVFILDRYPPTSYTGHNQLHSTGAESKSFIKGLHGSRFEKIGLHFGIGKSGVSQTCRRIAQKIKKDKKLKKKIVGLERKINLSRMKT